MEGQALWNLGNLTFNGKGAKSDPAMEKISWNALFLPFATDIMINSDLVSALQQRVLVLDGAMGTMIQQRKLNEQQYRGLPESTRFENHGIDLKGNNESVSTVAPVVVLQVLHRCFPLQGFG